MWSKFREGILLGLGLAVGAFLWSLLDMWESLYFSPYAKPLASSLLVGAMGTSLYIAAVAIWDRREVRRKERQEAFRRLKKRTETLRDQLSDVFTGDYRGPLRDVFDAMLQLNMRVEKFGIPCLNPIAIEDMEWGKDAPHEQQRHHIVEQFWRWHQFLNEMEVHMETRDIEAARLLAPRVKAMQLRW